MKSKMRTTDFCPFFDGSSQCRQDYGSVRECGGDPLKCPKLGKVAKSQYKIEIREDLIDWLEHHANGLSREDCEEFAQEFISFIVMTGALITEVKDDD